MKFNIAHQGVPLFVTLASVQGFQVQVSPTLTTASAPVLPLSHLSHFSPFGIQKLNTAALLLPLLFTVAQHQGANVEVVPTLIVAAVQVSPLSPLGIVKSNTASLVVQEFTTQASVQGAQVQVLPTFIVAASPFSP